MADTDAAAKSCDWTLLAIGAVVAFRRRSR